MPRIKTTRTVTIALLLLRVYLIGMLLLILAKFVMDARHPHSKQADATTISEKDDGAKDREARTAKDGAAAKP